MQSPAYGAESDAEVLKEAMLHGMQPLLREIPCLIEPSVRATWAG